VVASFLVDLILASSTFFHEVGAQLFVEIRSDGGRRNNNPLIRFPPKGQVTRPFGENPSRGLPSHFLYFYYYLRYFYHYSTLTSTASTETRTWNKCNKKCKSFGALFLLRCPTSYKDPPIYMGLRTLPLRQLHLFLPNRQLYTLFKGITVTTASYGNSNVSSHGRSPFHVTPFVPPSHDTALHLGLANVSLYARLPDK
jgi:hypothetical protein